MLCWAAPLSGGLSIDSIIWEVLIPARQTALRSEHH